MATYATTKILKKAQPAVRISDNIVKSWDIEVLYTYTRDRKSTRLNSSHT